MCLRRMRQFVLVKHVEHTVQEVLVSVHGIHGYNLFSCSRFEAHWELLKILPWPQVNGLDFPSYLGVQTVLSICVLHKKSTTLLCSMMGWRQVGKVNGSTPCVTVSPAITTLAPCDSRTGSSLPQSSSSLLKTSLHIWPGYLWASVHHLKQGLLSNFMFYQSQIAFEVIHMTQNLLLNYV